MKLSERTRTALVLFAFAFLFLTLTGSSFTGKSATWDEPQHLATGYHALRLGDYRIDVEHPPFLRLWAALPLRAVPVTVNTNALAAGQGEAWFMNQFIYCHHFLYELNDADKLLYAGRWMIALLGVLLGVLIYCWAKELWGFWPAVGALALTLVEPNILAHASLVTTDFGVTVFIFGAVYFLWRCTRRFTIANIAGLTIFFALAQISKYTALLLGPIVFVLLVIHGIRRRQIWPALGVVVLLAVASYAAMWAVYGFRYAPAPGGVEPLRADLQPLVQARAPKLASIIRWVDERHLLPNACTQGFLLGQAKAQLRSAYLAGTYSVEGWWYFFPLAFLIKTPVGLLVLLAIGVGFAAWRWRTALDDTVFWIVPVVMLMGTAMLMKLNIGLRHILPVYPFVILLAGLAIHHLWERRRVEIAGLLVAVATLELAFVYPNYLAFFNIAVGGPRHGHDYLVDSNLDWGQDLKGLQKWMRARDVAHINLSYFGTADPRYYGIPCTVLPGSPFFAEQYVSAPVLPGYVAVSATNLRGVYMGEAGRAFYRPLLGREPIAQIGHSILIYWVEKPWW